MGSGRAGGIHAVISSIGGNQLQEGKESQREIMHVTKERNAGKN
jgi:hypothetical protein